VSAGDLDWKQLMRDFWRDFSAAVGETKDLKISQVIDALDEVLAPHIFPPSADGSDPRKCPTCGDGRLNLKLGRFGAFVGCTNYPECRFTRQLGAKEGGDSGPRELGLDPATGEKVTLRSGRFGPYVQLGEAEKPKRSGIPKGWDASALDLEAALRLLSLPREVGKHPEDGLPITANFGRFGPYVAHNGKYASLESADDVFTVGLNHAVTIIAEKKAKGFTPRGAQALKELGPHPVSGKVVKIMKGRYGPYISDGETNATIPRGANPENVTMDEAVALIAEREAKGGGKKKKPKKAAAPKKAAEAKKPTEPKKAAAKKAAPKTASAKTNGAEKTAARAKKKPEPAPSE
jgi:DNA topoisomerase-1